MVEWITRIYRIYVFYSSPAKYVIRRVILNFFKKCSPCHTVLEIGSGSAMISSVLKSVCGSKEYITSDIAPTNQTAIVCDAQQLPFRACSVDMIASFEVVEHIPDTEKFLSEIVRVLKPEGYIVLSMPFLYGRHDFQDFYRWTAQGLERILNLHGMELLILQNRGGTFLTITALLSNYIHSIFSPSSGSWRAQGIGKKLYFGIMTILMFPIIILSWLAFSIDLLVDRHSANPSGFICIAQKKGNTHK